MQQKWQVAVQSAQRFPTIFFMQKQIRRINLVIVSIAWSEKLLNKKISLS